MKSFVFLLLSLALTGAQATSTHTSQPSTASHATANASAKANASASQKQAQQQAQKQVANGGSAQQSLTNANTATGGAGGDADQSQTQSASNTNSGNQDTQINYNTARQVPPVMLGSLMVSECGAGANAGASSGGGAGAFGVVWTTKRCYALRSAINFFAIGEYETGCELLVYVNKDALKAVNRTPDCAVVAKRLQAEAEMTARPQSPLPVDSSKYVTREEFDRAWRQSQAK